MLYFSLQNHVYSKHLLVSSINKHGLLCCAVSRWDQLIGHEEIKQYTCCRKLKISWNALFRNHLQIGMILLDKIEQQGNQCFSCMSHTFHSTHKSVWMAPDCDNVHLLCIPHRHDIDNFLLFSAWVY